MNRAFRASYDEVESKDVRFEHRNGQIVQQNLTTLLEEHRSRERVKQKVTSIAKMILVPWQQRKVASASLF